MKSLIEIEIAVGVVALILLVMPAVALFLQWLYCDVLGFNLC